MIIWPMIGMPVIPVSHGTTNLMQEIIAIKMMHWIIKV